MCIIAVSKRGVRQPTLDELNNMFDRNPDGAGYMVARNGVVEIHKGFMDKTDFIREIMHQNFTENDPVVYHFRISTQAGICPTMTHPFPLTENLDLCEELDLTCPIGLAHNGIIRMTSSVKETRFSDTALFVSLYMTRLVRERKDLTDPAVIDMIENLTNSKWAMLDSTGDIVTVGKFEHEDGVLFSNTTYQKPTYKIPCKTTIKPPVKFNWDDYYNGAYGYTI